MQFTEAGELHDVLGFFQTGVVRSNWNHLAREVQAAGGTSPVMAATGSGVVSWAGAGYEYYEMVSGSVQALLTGSPPLEVVGDIDPTISLTNYSSAAAGGRRTKDVRIKKPTDPAAPATISTITFTKDDVEAYQFEREDVPGTPLSSSPGLLAGALARSRRLMKLVVYLPTRTTIRVDLPPLATVNDVITEVVKKHNAEGSEPFLRASNCYELRLADDDGYPDEDCPFALDRNRKIKDFGQEGLNEYCLCEIPGAMPMSKSETRVRRLSMMAQVPCILVLLPPESLARYTVIKLSQPDMRAKDVIPLLAANRKYRLSLYNHQYQLRLLDSDQQRLRMDTAVLGPNVRLRDLDVEELELVKRVFADSPPEQDRPRRMTDEEANANQPAPSNPSQPGKEIMYNLVTAAAYKEWNVIKVNKRGRRQERIIGIDLTRVSNKKIEKRRLLSPETVRRAERLISDVMRLEIPDESGTVFFITFQESPSETITVEYEAKSPEDRAEIFQKLSYIMNLDHHGDRIVSPGVANSGAAGKA